VCNLPRDKSQWPRCNAHAGSPEQHSLGAWTTTQTSMPPYKRQKKENDAIEFDLSARADFLTGFHKMKLQRIKHAREEAIKREKAERITERKRVSIP
jgi:hypothetical protein